MTTRIQYDKLKSNFELALQKTGNKKFLAEREINAIQKFAYEELSIEGALRMPVYHFRSVFEPTEIGSATHYPFKEVFDEMMCGSTRDLSIHYPERVINEAEQLFKYYEYLENFLVQEKKNIGRKSKGLSHKQKLLGLYYLGLDINNFDNSKLAKVLSDILDLSEDNTRQYLSYLSGGKNKVRTKSNLQKIEELFRNQDLKEIASEIKNDIDQLK